MNRRLAWVLIFALGVSGVASLIVYRLISYRMVSAANQPTIRLLVAARDLPIGTMMRETDLKEMEWRGKPPALAMTERKKILERGVVATIYEGEPIQENRLAAEGAGAGLAATIPEHKRAVAVRVNDVVSLGGFVTPGMKVDVVVMGAAPGAMNAQGHMSKTILQNIQVLSAGQKIQKDAEGKPVQVQVVSLMVSPEEAEILSLASNHANIQLVLRNPLDNEQVTTPGTAMAKLLSGSPMAPAVAANAGTPVKPRVMPKPKVEPPPVVALVEPPKVQPPIVVELIHGAKKTQATFKAEEKEPEAKPEEQKPR